MGPRPSISGELPIESYFGSGGRTAGPSGSKENRSLKRKNALDASGSDGEWAPTKKHKTKAPSKGSHTGPESKANHTRSKELGVSSASMPTPTSIMKPPLRPSVQIPDDVDVISIASSSPTQMAPLSARATAHPSSKNSSSGFGLPTPQTVSHGSKTRYRADSASHLQSRSVAQSGSPLPQTPSRSKSKLDVNHTPRTTPHSQRIVPSSQYFDDEQSSLVSSQGGIVDGRDPFLLPHSRGPNEELALPSLFKLPHPPSRVPTSVSSSSLPLASVSSNGCSSRHRSQNSQIVPTSQFDEVELILSSDTQALPLPVRSPQVKHDKNVPYLKRLDLGPLPNSSPRPKDKVTQESPDDIHHTPPHPPLSPLTPLTPSSPGVPDTECEKVGVLESDGPPSQQVSDKAQGNTSISLSPEPATDKATPLSTTGDKVAGPFTGHTRSVTSVGFSPDGQQIVSGSDDQTVCVWNAKSDVPAVEDPTSDEDENFIVHPSPVRRRSSPLTGCTPSASTRRHLRISHAKLRSLPAATVELDSDGEEMSSDTSIDEFPSSPGVSCPANSYFDLNGTLPPEVEDFLDMVGTNASSDT